ncbi:MAG TPA: DUF305 domain-containing protein [Alphaproteobacteria bacterium]|nr:DUF305 domain-containing protein [Alphaproteobacteria bacterium]HNS43622.1 DUF305 domain-containing protein [Alphaproteobacteria bacterium]
MTRTKSPLLMATAAILLMGAASAHAEEHEMKMDMDHTSMKMDMPMEHPAMMEGMYGDAMKKMHEGMMAAKPTGDADVDFVTGMIPHHQGAIDMAKVVLEKGKDPEIKKLAEGIIKAQESEIKMMNDWLAAHK